MFQQVRNRQGGNVQEKFRSQWSKSRDAIAMCDAIQIAHPQLASDVIFFVASDAKTPFV